MTGFDVWSLESAICKSSEQRLADWQLVQNQTVATTNRKGQIGPHTASLYLARGKKYRPLLKSQEA